MRGVANMPMVCMLIQTLGDFVAMSRGGEDVGFVEVFIGVCEDWFEEEGDGMFVEVARKVANFELSVGVFGVGVFGGGDL